MSKTAKDQQDNLLLPDSVATKRDVLALIHELEQADSTITSVEVKTKVGAAPKVDVVLSDLLMDFLHANRMQLGDGRVRSQLIAQLHHLTNVMPIVNVTFATEADADSLQKLVAWVRESVHPQAVIAVGLQPDLIGGVYVRTLNQVYDLSLRAQLKDARHLISEELEVIRAGR